MFSHITRKELNASHLRAYLHQFLTSSNLLVKDLEEYLGENFSDRTNGTYDVNWDLDSFSEAELYKILIDNGLLEDDEKHLVFVEVDDGGQIEKNSYRFGPRIFRGIGSVSADNGGMILLRGFYHHEERLFNAEGEELASFNLDEEDVELGVNGLFRVTYTHQEYDSYQYFTDYYQYTEGRVIKLKEDAIEVLDAPGFFPSIGYRDIIPAMLQWEHMVDYSYPSDTLSAEKVKEDLLKYRYSYRVLNSYYRDNEELAILAVRTNPMAFTLLSQRLQNDKGFIIQLLQQNLANGDIYRYLKSDFKTDSDIYPLCIDSVPEVLRYMPPVTDKESLRELLSKGENIFRFASDEIKRDQEFILEMAGEGRDILEFISENLASDEQFISQVKEVYDEYYRLKQQEYKDSLQETGLPF